MKLKIINYGYYDNRSNHAEYNAPILIFICRDKDFKRHIVFICDKKELAPEFYVEKKEFEQLKETIYVIHEALPQIISVEDAPNSNYGEETIKITTTFPWEVGKLKKVFSHTYLADIKWEKMCIEKMGLTTPYIEVTDNYTAHWLKVNEIKPLPLEEHFYVPIRWIAWDIETDLEKVFPIFGGWKDAEKCAIASISAYDSYTKEYNRFVWHPRVQHDKNGLLTYWERKGSYYVPALKKEKEYNIENSVYTHEFLKEKDMLIAYLDWYARSQPDAQFGFNSEGGYRITSKKGRSRKRWFDGYDMPYLYHRCKTLGLTDYIQRMSPMPNKVKGVKFRKNGKRVNVAIECVCQLDFIYSMEIFMYHKKFNDFRGGNLQSFMSFFLGFGKVQHKEQVFEMWRDNITSDYDPSNPKLFGTKEKTNLVKQLYEQAKNRDSG